jgi:hypothetical protein
VRQKSARRIIPLDGPKGRRSREEHVHAVVADHPPEGTGVGRTHRLALVQDGSAACQQGRVDDVGVAHHPAHVARSPVDVARPDVVDVLHRPPKGHSVAPVVAHHAFRPARRPRGVQDVERIGRLQAYALHRLRRRLRYFPGKVSAGDQRRLNLGALHDHALRRLVHGKSDRLVEQRFVLDDPIDLDAARGGDDYRGLGVVDAHSQLMGCESAEDDGVDGADAGAGQHGNDGLGDHRQVEEHRVGLRHSERTEGPGEQGHPFGQLPVGVARHRAGHRAVVDERRLLAPPGLDVVVEAVVTGVETAARKPAIQRCVGGVEHAVPALVPLDGVRRLPPETFRILDRTAECLGVAQIQD